MDLAQPFRKNHFGGVLTDMENAHEIMLTGKKKKSKSQIGCTRHAPLYEKYLDLEDEEETEESNWSCERVLFFCVLSASPKWRCSGCYTKKSCV